MKLNRWVKNSLGAALLAAGAIAGAPASAVTFTTAEGSITIPEGAVLAVTSLFENAVVAPGQELAGVGLITSINGVLTPTLCSGPCELTFRFEDYIATSVTASTATFIGGITTVFLDFSPEFNPFTSPDSATDLANATDGTVFLNLAGHADASGTTLSAFATSGAFGTPTFSAFGQGALSVAAGPGIANVNFDTNTIVTSGGLADLFLTSSANTFFPVHPAECPGGPECLSGSADIRGFVTAVPEPGSLALLGLAFAGMGLMWRRRLGK